MKTPFRTRISSDTLSGTVLSEDNSSNLEADADHVLVIGYGNPLRGDDGFGWQVVQALSETNLGHLEVIACHQLTPELAEPLSHAARAVFVDASVMVPPGVLEIRAWVNHEREPASMAQSFTHHLTPAHLLALARTLYGRAPQATLITVGAVNLSHAEHLSPEVKAMIPGALEAIARDVDGASWP